MSASDCSSHLLPWPSWNPSVLTVLLQAFLLGLKCLSTRTAHGSTLDPLSLCLSNPAHYKTHSASLESLQSNILYPHLHIWNVLPDLKVNPRSSSCATWASCCAFCSSRYALTANFSFSSCLGVNQPTGTEKCGPEAVFLFGSISEWWLPMAIHDIKKCLAFWWFGCHMPLPVSH